MKVMNTKPQWLSRNVALRQLGLPVIDDWQSAAMETRLRGMAALVDEAITTVEGRPRQTVSLESRLADPVVRRLAALLAELAWRVPPACNDLAAQQASMLDALNLIDPATLDRAKASPAIRLP